jgi:WD40 repeat protein
LIIALSGKYVNVWGGTFGFPFATLKYNDLNFSSAVLSPNGKMIITTTPDKTMQLWEVPGGKLINTIPVNTPYAANQAEFNKDGKLILAWSRDNKVAQIYEVSSGKLLYTLTGHNNEISSASFSPDGKSVMTASFDANVRIWDAASGKQIRTEIIPDYLCNGGLGSVTFTPDGQRALIKSSNKVSVWSIFGGVNFTIGHTGSSILSTAVSADGSMIVTASSDNTAIIWDANTVINILTFTGHRSSVTAAVFSHDGKTLLTQSTDGTARLWDIQNGKMLYNVSGHLSAAFSPAGRHFVTASFYEALWDTAKISKPTLLKGNTNGINSLVYHPDGTQILAASKDNTAKVWNSNTGDLLYSLEYHSGAVQDAVYSPNGQYILTVSADGSFIIWNAKTGTMLHRTFILNRKEYVTMNAAGEFDCSPGAMNLLYLVQGFNIVEPNNTSALYRKNLWSQSMASK